MKKINKMNYNCDDCNNQCNNWNFVIQNGYWKIICDKCKLKSEQK